MGNQKLYSHSRIGTKTLISFYIDEVVRQLNWVCDELSPELNLRAKHEFFMTIRQSFGRTALLLSGGGTLGLNHLGVLKCLHSARLLPRIISGASSGSIMASMLCTKTDDEIPYMFNPTGIKLVTMTSIFILHIHICIYMRKKETYRIAVLFLMTVGCF